MSEEIKKTVEEQKQEVKTELQDEKKEKALAHAEKMAQEREKDSVITEQIEEKIIKRLCKGDDVKTIMKEMGIPASKTSKVYRIRKQCKKQIEAAKQEKKISENVDKAQPQPFGAKVIPTEFKQPEAALPIAQIPGQPQQPEETYEAVTEKEAEMLLQTPNLILKVLGKTIDIPEFEMSKDELKFGACAMKDVLNKYPTQANNGLAIINCIGFWGTILTTRIFLFVEKRDKDKEAKKKEEFEKEVSKAEKSDKSKKPEVKPKAAVVTDADKKQTDGLITQKEG